MLLCLAVLTVVLQEMGTNIARLYQGLLSIGPFVPWGSEAFFADVSQLTFVIKSCVYNAQTLILDAVVVRISSQHIYIASLRLLQIYRTYVVWQNIWVVVVPTIGWLGLLGMFVDIYSTEQLLIRRTGGSIGLNVALVTAGTHKSDVFAAETGRWITAVYAMTLGTNLSSTSTSPSTA